MYGSVCEDRTCNIWRVFHQQEATFPEKKRKKKRKKKNKRALTTLLLNDLPSETSTVIGTNKLTGSDGTDFTRVRTKSRM